jgi:hypothetical protein
MRAGPPLNDFALMLQSTKQLKDKLHHEDK